MTSAPRRILLTGATGAFGRVAALALLEQGCEVVCLVRGRDPRDARRRLLDALGTGRLPSGLAVARGDVSLPDLGLEPGVARRLLATADVIVHCAATTDFGLDVDASRRVNVGGARNVLAFARRAERLLKLCYVSTAFVAGKRTGTIRESELANDAGFVTSYERSKFEAEVLVRRAAADLPLAILRPSIIVDADEAAAARPNALRFALSLLRNGTLPALPAASGTPIDLVDARDAACALARLSVDERRVGTYHLASGPSAPSLAALVDAAGTPPIRFVDVDVFDRELVRLRTVNPRAASAYRRLDSFIRLVSYPKVFDTSAAEEALGAPVARFDPLDAVRAMYPERERGAA